MRLRIATARDSSAWARDGEQDSERCPRREGTEGCPRREDRDDPEGEEDPEDREDANDWLCLRMCFRGRGQGILQAGTGFDGILSGVLSLLVSGSRLIKQGPASVAADRASRRK